MMKKAKNSKLKAGSRAMIGDVHIWCAYDELVDIKTLKPHPKNPNQHTDEQIRILAKIITENGWREVITVSTRSGYITKGHGRLMAAFEIGAKQVPVNFQNYPSSQAELQDLVADNKIAEMSYIDDALMDSIMQDLDSLDFDLDVELLGWEQGAWDDKFTGKKQRKDDAPAEKKQILKDAVLDDLAPSAQDRDLLHGKKIIIEFSGGKDSSATALWARYFLPDHDIECVFCDMGADWIGFNLFLLEFTGQLGVPIKIIRSPENIIDVILDKGKWPHFMFPFCQDVLHSAMDKYFASYDDTEIVIMRGGRYQEKAAQRNKKKRTPDCLCSACPMTETVEDNSRWMTVDRMPGYSWYQPLYYADKTVGAKLLADQGLPIWEGYSRGLKRTACRICPGQRPVVYSVMRDQWPDVWAELTGMEKLIGPGAWNRSWKGDDNIPTFAEMADRGDDMLSKEG